MAVSASKPKSESRNDEPGASRIRIRIRISFTPPPMIPRFCVPDRPSRVCQDLAKGYHMRPWRQPGDVGLRSPGDPFADRGRSTVSRSGIFFLPAQVGLCRIKISFSRFAFFGRPNRSRFVAENRKVGNGSLSARSDWSNGVVISSFYFPGFWTVWGLRRIWGLGRSFDDFWASSPFTKAAAFSCGPHLGT